MRYIVSLIALVVVTGGQAPAPAARPPAKAPAFNVFEASISDMQAAMKSGRTTSHEIVQQYLTRIATYEDMLHAAITVNPNALEEADALDRERAQGQVRGPLHGIPIALKDNIHTTNMPTTGGALAFDGLVPPYEATLTKNLRDAGAIIIAKTGHDRARELGRGQHADQLQRDPGLRLQSVRPAARSADDRRRPAGPADRRIELGHRHRGEFLGRQRRHRNVRIDPEPVEPEHARRRSSRRSAASAATASSRSPPTRTRRGRWRSTVTDVAIMLGALEGASPDPNDPATKRVHAAAGPRLHEVPARPTA